VTDDADAVRDAMTPLEPYTTDEVASRIDRTRDAVKRALRALVESDDVRRKSVGDRSVWIRRAPTYACPDCEYEFQVKPLHPVLTTATYCPRCGARVE